MQLCREKCMNLTDIEPILIHTHNFCQEVTFLADLGQIFNHLNGFLDKFCEVQNVPREKNVYRRL